MNLTGVPRPGLTAGRTAHSPGLATMPGDVPGPGRTTLIALAHCEDLDCDRECFLDLAACHIWAAAHRQATGHAVLVFETTTTSYGPASWPG